MFVFLVKIVFEVLKRKKEKETSFPNSLSSFFPFHYPNSGFYITRIRCKTFEEILIVFIKIHSYPKFKTFY